MSNFDPIPDNDIVDITTMLRAPDRLEPYLCAAAADEIKRLREERDEARRRLCLEWMEHGPVRLSKEQIAMRYGWDCFKENTNAQE